MTIKAARKTPLHCHSCARSDNVDDDQ